MKVTARSLRRTILAIGGLAIGLALASYWISQSHLSNSELVSHTYEVIANTELLQKTLVDMETGQRGFLLTGDEEFLEPFNDGLRNFNDIMTFGKELVGDNPAQLARLRSIQASYRAWLASAGESEIALRRAVDAGAVPETAIANVLQGLTIEGQPRVANYKSGKDLMDEVRGIFVEFLSVEQSLLIDRTIASEASAVLDLGFATVGMLLVVAVVLAAHWRLTRSATAALTTSEQRFRATFDLGAVGMALVDLRGRFIEVNDALATMLGCGVDELNGRKFEDVTDSDDLKTFRSGVRSLIAGGPSVQSELALQGRNGERVPVIASATLVEGEHGKPSHVIAQVVDVSELHAANVQLRLLLQARDKLVASVSHELRTPLTGVLGFAELLRDTTSELSPADQEQMITLIARQSQDLSNIVDDLLTAARVGSDDFEVAQVPVDLREETMQVVEGMDHGATVSVEAPERPVRGFADPGRVRQIVRNLVVNALRYGGDPIRVAFDVTGSHVALEVIDDGVGVAEGLQDLIFDGYETGSNAAGITGSLGLGLTVSRKLAELMNGGLTYHRRDSETVFRLSLPSVDLIDVDNVSDDRGEAA